MATLTIYMPEDVDLEKVRKGLRQVAHTLGYRAETGSHSGEGLLWAFITALARGEVVAIKPSGESIEEADILRGLRGALQAQRAWNGDSP